MSLGTILVIILILILIGVIPTWGHSRAWGLRSVGNCGRHSDRAPDTAPDGQDLAHCTPSRLKLG